MDKKTKEQKSSHASNKKSKKSNTGIKNIIKVLSFSKKQRLSTAIYFFIVILTVPMNMLYPILERRYLGYLELHLWKQFLICFAVYYLISLVINTLINIANLIINRANRKVWKSMMQSTMERFFPISLKKIDGENTGKLYNRIVDDPSSLKSLHEDFFRRIIYMVQQLGYVVVTFVFNWQVALYFSVTNLCLYSLRKWRISIRMKVNKKEYELKDYRSGLAKETLNGIRDVKCLNMQDTITEKYNKNLDQTCRTWNNYFGKACIFSVVITILNAGSMIGLGFICYFLFKQGSLSVATFLVLLSYSRYLSIFVDDLLSFIEFIKEKEITASRVMEVFDETIYPQDKFGTVHIAEVQGQLKIENLSFGYSDDKPLFNNLNLNFNSNLLTAIVGKSGEGKSTISNLLLHLYDYHKGIITMDGIDIKTLDRDSLRNNLSVIPQNPYIFNMSIKENLLLASPNATEDEIWKALNDSQLKEFVQQQSQQLNTLLGENGIQMSGGQKQRLAIARALLKNSKVIIFDEATSSLDNQSQAAIQKVMENLKGQHTLIVIAHRLSTIKNADKIVVLDNHKVAAEGTHAELIKTCKVYKDLYKDEQV